MKAPQLRPYQLNACAAVRDHWRAGTRRVLLVAPTGAGKTLLGADLIGQARSLWVAPRQEIVTQTAKRLRGTRERVGVMLSGHREDADAAVQVATIQSLLGRQNMPAADVVVLDEAHHYLAARWRELADCYPRSLIVGLTATPQRADGEPMGDAFDELVVAAHYSQLVADGFLVPATVLRPSESLGGDLAQDPIEAWFRHSGGVGSFFFAPRVNIAQEWTARLISLGVPAATIHANTPGAERLDCMARFRAGKLRALCNVNTLTEGVDVPEAGCAVLGRSFGFVGDFLQAVGRILRPSKGKERAIVLDLVGATHRHGLPTDDRSYALRGRPISGEGFEREQGERASFAQEIKGLELQTVGAMPAFAPPAVIAEPRDESKLRAEYDRLTVAARDCGRGPALAAIKFRELFGHEPPSEWRNG